MSVISYYFPNDCDVSGSWCRCVSSLPKRERTYHSVLQCKCGEEKRIHKWNWEVDTQLSIPNVVLSNNNLDVLFHPTYSSGTAAVRGNLPLQHNVHHYWEIKILTHLYGTDVMIGVGTSRMVMSEWQLRFSSMLGCNRESWGFSYTGFIQHNCLTRSYGSCFTMGSLIGVHLDMWTGTLRYYLNRRPLGVAFTNVKKCDLYPMVCSTAAHSAMRITCSLSEPPSLQIDCLKFIAKYPTLVGQFWSIPGIARMLEKKYFWLIPSPPVKNEFKLELEDECVLSTDLINQHYQRMRRRTDHARKF